MPQTKLSDVGLRSLPLPEKGTIDYWDLTLPSFACRVSQGGAKTFILKTYNSRRAIGRWPLVSLADARREAKRLLAEKTLGRIRPQSITVAKARELFLKEKEKARRARTVQDLKDRLDRHFDIPGQLGKVTHNQIVRRLDPIKTPQEFNAALRVGRTFFSWCTNRRYITENPTTGIERRSVSSRSRVLSDEELKSIWIACSETHKDMPEDYRIIVKLLILVGQRKTETAAIQRIFVSHNQRTLCLPDTLTKNKREHLVPLGRLALALLNPLLTRESILFPARGKSTLFNGWSKSKKALDLVSGITNWTLHDLRRTFRTIHARMGTPPHIAERLVNHISARSDVEDIYDRHTYLPEMALAMENYEHYLLQNVLP
ncbi:tyrosine-type recombinase/integrase [Bradyrhizobium elkanii]